MGGTCKSCTQQPTPEISNMERPEQPGIKNETIRKIQLYLIDFQTYQIVKRTQYQYHFNGVHRKGNFSVKKVIDSQGTVKPVNLTNLKQANSNLQILHGTGISKSMKFKCGLELGDSFPQVKMHLLFDDPQGIEMPPNVYTLIKSWGQGEQMVNFEHAKELGEKLSIKIVGLTRGNEEQQSVYEELVRSNQGWQQHKHIYIDEPDGHILDIYYDEESNEVIEGHAASALLFYGDKLIWKRYTHEWEMGADSEEVAAEVTKLIEGNIKQPTNTVAQNLQSSISREEYIRLKKYIQQQQPQPYTREIELTINKKTIYSKEDKRVYYEKPIIRVQCSPKSLTISAALAQPLNCHLLNWDSKILKNALIQKIKENNLTIEASLEKQIKIHINYETCILNIQDWESATLIPYYKSTQYIAQVKQWIHARDRILNENTPSFNDPVQEKVHKMILQFFQNIPTVQKVLNQEYGKIPYAEKRKPPYEEMSFSKSLGNEEITRKQDKVLLILLIDYENDDTLEILKKLIKYKKDNNAQIQIAVLGHIRAESWTKLFQAFMEKHKLNRDAEEGIIETWFPIEDKIGSITFSAILSKMYGMVLEKRDCMIIDLENQVRVIDSSRRVVPNLDKLLQDIQSKNLIQDKEIINYQKQYIEFKKCIRENPQLNQLTLTIKEQCRDDDCLIIYEQKKSKVWDFEGGSVQEVKKYQQPTRTLRVVPKTPEAEEFTKIITKYVDQQDILQLK